MTKSIADTLQTESRLAVPGYPLEADEIRTNLAPHLDTLQAVEDAWVERTGESLFLDQSEAAFDAALADTVLEIWSYALDVVRGSGLDDDQILPRVIAALVALAPYGRTAEPDSPMGELLEVETDDAQVASNTGALTPDDLELLREALDSYEYWEHRDQLPHDSGHITLYDDQDFEREITLGGRLDEDEIESAQEAWDRVKAARALDTKLARVFANHGAAWNRREVDVLILNDYEDGHHSSFTITIPAPADSDDEKIVEPVFGWTALDKWFNDVVFDFTGDGHGADDDMGSCYTARIIHAADARLIGKEQEWVG